MDDIFSEQGGQQVKTPIAEAWHSEQRRKEYDIIRVINPREIKVKGVLYVLPTKDFYVMYDVNQYQKIPFGSQIDIPRPRAERYVKHKKDEIINFVTDLMHDTFIQDRRKKGIPDYADKSVEDRETYSSAPYPKTNDDVIINEIFDQLWLGIVIKAAQDIPPNMNKSTEIDLKSGETKAIDRMNSKQIDPKTSGINEYQPTPQPQAFSNTPPPAASVSSFANLNKKLSPEDITQE